MNKSSLSVKEQNVILFHEEFVQALRSKGILMTQEVARNGNLIAQSSQIGANIGTWIKIKTSYASFSVEVGRENSQPITWEIPTERVSQFTVDELASEVRLSFYTI